MNRIISILIACLLHATLSVASAYNLRVEVTPGGAGTLNISSGTYEQEASIYLRTYNNTGYQFKGWFDGDTLLSSSNSFYYTMPARDALVQARYEYDPTVPGNPAMPDTTKYYVFSASVSPVGAGTLNIYSGKYAAGANIGMRAYVNSGYHFAGWRDENGDTLSKTTSYNYKMPQKDAHLTALYYYDPDLPSNPNPMGISRRVTVECKPVGGGTFNTSNTKAEAGSSLRLYSYTNTGYKFLHWENEEGEIIATGQNFNYAVPDKDSKIYGVFEYDPVVPGNPNKNYWNKDFGEVIVDDFNAGSLSSAISTTISGNSSSDVAMITVAGRMNSNDFGVANNYSNCTLLDLSRVTGITEVPSYAFDYSGLESVYLPSTIESIGYRAFYDCTRLSSLTIYSMTPPTLENYVFDGVPEGLIIYVPAAVIAQYQEADGWKDFTFLPIQEDIRSISVSLPEGANVADYTQMWLELTNTKSGQRMHYVMTDRQTYTFANIIRNTSWNVTLRNERGDIFGKIDNVEVKDEDVSVAFSSLSKPQSVVLSVLTPDGEDVTAQAQVTWTDAQGNYLAQGVSLTGLPTGYQTTYRIVLSQELAMVYNAPQPVDYVLTDDNNRITYQLNAIPQVKISGKVKDASTGLALSGAIVSVSQTFGGKYSKTLNAKTDGNGAFTLDIANVPTSVAFAASDYVSQTVNCDSLLTGEGEVTLPDVSLRTITGATITLGLTYTTCEEETQNWYSDYQNVNYELFNVTKNKVVSQYNVQYPQIVLLEEVADGDVLRLTATSRTNAFMPVTATATIAEQKAEATFAVVELGKIQSSFTSTGNAAVVGSLYDAAGKLLKTYNYSEASLTISDLADGNYTLVSMGSSRLFNTIYDLAQFPQTGLVENVDYVQNSVEVKNGKVSFISINEVPTLDESKLYYTGDNTTFSVNKSSIVVGNYLTLTGKLDFKPSYANNVSNVQLIVDIPEKCSFVENSVMVGNSISSYTLNGSRLTIPMANYADRVRFCVIPTHGGSCNISALTSFEIAGIPHTQPIGTAHATIKDIAISVPSVINTPQILVKGRAVAGSKIKVYCDNVLSGTSVSNRAGNWQCQIDFESLSSFSEHSLWAQIEVSDELTLLTESKSVTFDEECPIINKVTMINTAHPSNSLNLCEYVTTFDFTNSEVPGTYWYWPSYPEFTFIANIDSGKGNRITDVTIYVLTEQGRWIPLKSIYDSTLNCWIATERFHSGELPINIGVTYHYTTDDVSIERFIGAVNKTETEYIYESLEPANTIVSDDGKILTFTYNGNTDTDFYVKKVFADGDKVSVEYTDDGENYNLDMSFTGTNDIPKDANEYRINQDNYFYMTTETSGSSSKVTICYPVAMIENIVGSNIVNWAYAEFFNSIKQYAIGTKYVLLSYEIFTEKTKPISRSSVLDEAENNCPDLAPIIDRMRRRSEHSRRMNRDLDNFRNPLGNIGNLIGRLGRLGNAAGAAINTGSNAIEFGQGAGNYINSLADRNDMAALQAAGCIPPPPEPETPNPNGNSDYVMDPSGYVYEAVANNRLEGVTATAFYKETIEDMYGDLQEHIVKWNAEEYAQENPLFTDANGMYAWDVPKGLWQVKFEKEGYETTYSEWLPVPPPQLDVNIAMKQNRQPEVKAARAYEDAVEVEFDKYMMPELLTAENIMVMQNGTAVEGNVELLNEEVSYEGESETFASKIRFNATQPFTENEVTLLVNNRVKSYAGTRMQDNYQQTFTIEQEIRQIVCDSVVTVGYGNASTLTVSILPVSASKGKILTVKTSSPMILGVETEQVIIGNDGKADISVSGELPGVAVLTFSVEGTDKTAMTVVNVEQIKTVATPTAGIVSGASVEKGTAVTLTCETEGATIYYTLDGSCPCDNTDALKVYDGTPIIINENVTIKAMAVAPDMYESDVAEFTYLVEETGVDDVTVNGQIQIYPLPVRESVNICAGGKIIKSVIISSLNGVEVAFANEPATMVTLDLSGISTGIYIINITTVDGTFSRKILKVE